MKGTFIFPFISPETHSSFLISWMLQLTSVKKKTLQNFLPLLKNNNPIGYVQPRIFLVYSVHRTPSWYFLAASSSGISLIAALAA